MTRSELEELDWQEVESSNVKRVCFVPTEGKTTDENEQLGEFWVEFKSTDARVYRYSDVIEADAQSVREADSVGKALNAAIKPTYEHRVISVEEDR